MSLPPPRPSSAPLPPRWSALLLRWALPETLEGESILGDLLEEFRRRRQVLPSAARNWYRRQALSVMGHLAWRQSVRLASAWSRFFRRPFDWKGSSTMRDFSADIRFALRSFIKRPGFTIIALLTLALGIGVNTAVFNIVNAVLLRPLPVEQPGRLATVYATGASGTDYGTQSYPDYLDLRSQVEGFTSMTAYCHMFGNLQWEGRTELLIGEVADCNYFDFLGVRPQLGRGFLPEECVAEGARPVAVLGHDFWQKRFGGQADALGQTVSINDVEFEVVGVAPASFKGLMAGLSPALWVPIMMTETIEPVGMQDSAPSPGDTRLERRGQRWLTLVGRRAEGVSLEQAQSQVQTVMARLAQEYPRSNESRGALLLPTSEVRVHPDADTALGPVAYFLLGVVGLVLLIACANVANMFLARVSTRRREIALRLALGAGRGRLVRQLLTESVLLAGAGGALGILLALVSMSALAAMPLPIPITVDVDLSMDWRVLLFALGVSCATGIVFGLAPALQSTRSNLIPALKDADSSHSQGRRSRFGMRQALVVAQVALSTVLLVGAGLLARSFNQAQSIDLGFPADRLALMSFSLDTRGYSSEQGYSKLGELARKLEGLPGVEAAALANPGPFSLNVHQGDFRLPEQAPSENPHNLDLNRVGPGYFETLQVKILQGRGCALQDRPDSPRVAVVNKALAQRLWPRESAVGQRLLRADSRTPIEIVGISENYKVRTVGEAPRPFLNLCSDQAPTASSSILVRTRRPAREILPLLRSEVLAEDANMVFLEFGTLRQQADRSLFGVRAGALFLSGFSIFALFLAAVGLYGVIAYSVSGRTREIGTRMALGARAGDVQRQVVMQGMRLVLAGALLGIVLAGLASQFLSGVLYGIQPLDPASFLLAAGVLIGAALLANYLPARRASRIDPLLALRAE
ncbi:MAG TPA: ADOP family duplicated permease [Acidobacteriota bacterium]|nr:ADOP family duplicated permease [Acidobacteriota bacterium]